MLYIDRKPAADSTQRAKSDICSVCHSIVIISCTIEGSNGQYDKLEAL
jgi:hypothetical protein